MSGFYIKKIIARSTEKGDASISFGPGLNIIQGRSDTGKSCVAYCLDFIFGGATDKPFKPSAKYTSVTMTVASYDGGKVTLSREVGKRQVSVVSEIDGIEDGTYDVDYKKNGQKNPVLNSIWLQLMGIDGQPMIPADINFTKKRLTWKNLLRLFYIDENRVDDMESVVLPARRYVENTLFLSALLFLINGRDFSQTDAQENKEKRKARRKAVSDFVNRKLQEAADKRKKLEADLHIFDGADIEHQIDVQLKILHDTKAAIDKAISESQTLLSSILETEERKAECDILLSRYRHLQEQYKADIRRLSFIVNGEVVFGTVLQSDTCPFCEGKISPHVRETYVQASKAELSRTVAQLDGLGEAEKDVQNEKREIDQKLTALKEQRTALEARIKNELQPKESSATETIKAYKAYLKLRDEVSFVEDYAHDWGHELDVLEQEKDDDILQYRPREYFSEDFQTVMTEYAEEILRECNYTGLTNARFSFKDFDIEVNGEEKGTSHGKGYRSYLNAVVVMMFRKYLHANAKYGPRMFIIDTPLHGFDDGVSENVPESMKKGLYTYFMKHQNEGQLIIIENLDHIPNLPYEENGAVVETFQKGLAPGRFGFLNITE